MRVTRRQQRRVEQSDLRAADGAQPAQGVRCLPVVDRGDDDLALRVEHRAGARPEAGAVERHVQRSGQVLVGEVGRRAHVEHLLVAV